MSKPYELLARFKADGTIAGIYVQSIQTVNGKDYELDPVPLSGATDPAFTQFANQFSAAIVAERDQLLIDKAAIEQEKIQAIAAIEQQRDQAIAAKQATETILAEANARIAELELQLNPPGPDLTTEEGVRQHLRDVRYARETNGFSIEGQSITTNRDESATWLGMLLSLSTNPQPAYPYTPRNGETVLLTPQQVARAGSCYQWYVLQCFAKEYEFTQRLKAGDPLRTLVEAINDISSWPQTQFQWTPE